MKISIVIPLYIPTHLLAKINEFLVPQIEAFDKYTDCKDLEIIYVANGCDPRVFETLVYLEKTYPKLNIKTIWHNEALGYTVATNIGIRDAKGEFILLFNDDCIILWQHEINLWLNLTLDPFKDEKVGITSIHKQYCPYAGGDFGIGYYLCLRKKMLDEIGILDEVFSPGSGEDIDICLRAKKMGWKLHFIEEGEYKEGVPFALGKFPLYHKSEVSFHNWFAINDMGGGRCEKIFVKNRGILKERKDSGHYNHYN